MKIETIDIHDMHPFKDVHLDLREIEGTLVAVTGTNGEGKTTLLELMFGGAMYRRCPTRGPLTELALSRTASLEVRCVNGHAYTIRQTADAISGSSEALILDEDGNPVLPSTKVTDADAWVAEHLPPPEILYAGPFLAQASSGFLRLKARERKSVLLRLLQIEHYEVLAERAKENAKRAKATSERLTARMQEAVRRYPPLGQAETEVEASTQAVAQAQEAVLATQAELERARAQAQALVARAPLEHHIKQQVAQLVELRERIANNRMLLDRQDEIEAAEKMLTAAATEQRDLEAKEEAARERSARASLDVGKLEKTHETKTNAITRAQERVQAIAKRLRESQAVKKAVADLPGAKTELATAKAKLVELQKEFTQTDKRLLTHKDDRIGGLREGLAEIAGGVANPKAVAAGALTADDKRKQSASSAPAKLQRLNTQLETAQGKVEVLQETVSKLRAQAERAKDLKSAQDDSDAAKADLARARAEELDVTAGLKTARDTYKRAGQELAQLLQRRNELVTQMRQAQKFAKWFELVKTANAKLEIYEPQRAQLEGQLAASEAELAKLPPAPDAQALERAEAAHGQASQRVVAARDALSRRQERLATAREGVDVIAQIDRELVAEHTVLADWTRLAQDLGKDGLQALEIDAAIPSINTLANDLLHSCYGPRYTVELRTDRLDADGKRTLEDLDIRVLDTQEGRWKAVERLSGGQMVIVGEAVALALTMLVCQRSGIRHATLVRDETGAALAEGNGQAYIAMLRRAAAVLECDKVLFVTHDEQLKELADAQIVVHGGSAVIQQ